MNIKEILEKYLIDNKFKGFVDESGSDICECNLKRFMPCGGSICLKCIPTKEVFKKKKMQPTGKGVKK